MFTFYDPHPIPLYFHFYSTFLVWFVGINLFSLLLILLKFDYVIFNLMHHIFLKFWKVFKLSMSYCYLSPVIFHSLIKSLSRGILIFLFHLPYFLDFFFLFKIYFKFYMLSLCVRLLWFISQNRSFSFLLLTPREFSFPRLYIFLL